MKTRMRPSQFEIETLKAICKENNCGIETLIDAMMNNTVSEAVSVQINYLKNDKRSGPPLIHPGLLEFKCH